MKAAETLSGQAGPRYVEGQPFDFEAVDLGEILPHRSPVVMVDSLLSFSSSRTETEFRVRADCAFFEDGRLSAEGLMENVAQTNAARIGFINKYIAFRPVTVGYICRIRDFRVFFLPVAGAVLHTAVDLDGAVGAMTKVTANVYCGGEIIAAGAMTTMEADSASDAEAHGGLGLVSHSDPDAAGVFDRPDGAEGI